MLDVLYFTLSLCSLLTTISYIYLKISSSKRRIREFCIEKYESHIIILDYFCKKAYDLIYKEKIMIYSLEAMGLNEVEYQVVSKEFCSLVMKLLGSNLVAQFTNFFGDDKTLMFNILEYFKNRYENDQIKEQALDNIANREILVEKK